MKFLSLSTSFLLALAFHTTPSMAHDTAEVELNTMQLSEVNVVGDTCEEMSDDEEKYFRTCLLLPTTLPMTLLMVRGTNSS
mmetsp:Transcript_10582/g.16299  ORF Transcript_10582/g.16299 Transcript_10582/m.16299 type:complete len:81 (+) Transcript_10582:409-651(+)